MLEAEESKRLRMEGIALQIHEDHIAGKGSDEFTASFLVGTQIHSYASSNEDTCSESCRQKFGKTWENFGVESGESQKQLWSDQWSKK